MSNENQNKSGTSNVHTKDSEGSTLREFGGFMKSIAKPAVAGAAGIGIAKGVQTVTKAVFNRFAQSSTENAVASAFHGGGTKLKPF